MKEIKLTQGGVSIVDDENYDEINNFNWYVDSIGYASITLKSRIRMHRFIMKPKSNEYVDHINGDKLDNRKENLRICTKKENQRNQKVRKDNTSGYKGVALMAGKYWRAYITSGGSRQKHLGNFKTKEEAARAYDEKAKEYFGEFARLNFPK